MRNRVKILLFALMIMVCLFSIAAGGRTAWDTWAQFLKTAHTWTGAQTFGALTTTGNVSIGGTLTGGLSVISDADGVVLTSSDWGKMVVMTGAGEVALPNGTAADIGKYILVFVRDASEAVEVVLTDETELFVLTNGTALDAGDECNLPLTAGSMATFVYLETGKWYITGSANGTPTDGGAAD